MPMVIKRTGHLVLRVRDIERSRRFFTDVLGLKISCQNERMIFFTSDFNANHHMLAITQAREEGPMPDPEKQVGMVHVAYELENFAALRDAYRIFKENSVPITDTVFHGATKSVYFLDPDGNQLEVYCNVPPEEYNRTVPRPLSWYWSIDTELEGAPQKPGTVAP